MKKINKKLISGIVSVALMIGGLSLMASTPAQAAIAMGEPIYHEQVGDHQGVCADRYMVIPLINPQTGEIIGYWTTLISCTPL